MLREEAPELSCPEAPRAIRLSPGLVEYQASRHFADSVITTLTCSPSLFQESASESTISSQRGKRPFAAQKSSSVESVGTPAALASATSFLACSISKAWGFKSGLKPITWSAIGWPLAGSASRSVNRFLILEARALARVA